jgi:hypothetical protein
MRATDRRCHKAVGTGVSRTQPLGVEARPVPPITDTRRDSPPPALDRPVRRGLLLVLGRGLAAGRRRPPGLSTRPMSRAVPALAADGCPVTLHGEPVRPRLSDHDARPWRPGAGCSKLAGRSTGLGFLVTSRRVGDQVRSGGGDDEAVQGADQAQQHPQDHGLAGAVGSQEAGDRAGSTVKLRLSTAVTAPNVLVRPDTTIRPSSSVILVHLPGPRCLPQLVFSEVDIRCSTLPSQQAAGGIR